MRISTRQMVLFGLMGAVMYVSRQVMAALPNIHLVSMFIVVLTVVYRKKALFPLYTFVLLEGLFGGFNTWWLPYLYIWTVLWAGVMLLPKQMKPKTAAIVYTLVCGAHGFLYGVLYAPAQAIISGLNWQGMIGWIIQGLPYDLMHGCSNLAMGLMIMPLVQVIKKMDKTIR